MPDSQNLSQPFASSNEADRLATLASLNLPSAHQVSNLSASFDFDGRSSAPSSLYSSAATSPNSEHPPIRKDKSYLSISRPDSPATNASPDWVNDAPRESHHPSATQTGSRDASNAQDPLMSISVENFASAEETTRRICDDRNRLYFPPGANPLKSPAAGVSSSVDVISKDCPTEKPTKSESFITSSGISSKMTAHRRVSAPQDQKPTTVLHSDNTIRKSPLVPISVASSHTAWSERRGEKRGGSSFPGQNYLSSLLHILPLSSTSNNSPYSDRTPLPHLARRFPGSNLFWTIITFIPRLIVRFLQYLVSPWTSWLSLPDFLLRNNSFGDPTGAVKFRRKGLTSLIAAVYVIFCMLMFSHNVSLKLGLINGDNLVYRDARGEMIPRKAGELSWGNLFSILSPFESKLQMESMELEDEWNPQLALKRRPSHPRSSQISDNSAASLAARIDTSLSSMTHTTRFSKLHPKSGDRFSEEVTPLLFEGTHVFPTDSITACLYSNPFWLHKLSDFVRSWEGPISLVVESFSTDRSELITKIQRLRKMNSLIRQRVDFHIVLAPDGSSAQKLKNAQRMMSEPIATNAQLNVARFFCRSELVWLVGDARVLPSTGLYDLLSQQTSLRTRVLDYGDAIVIPNFAFIREKQVYPSSFPWTNEVADLDQMAQQYINESLSSIALPPDEWPKTREDLLRLTTDSNSSNPDTSVMVMYDQAWKPSQGPTNWTMWQKFDPKFDSEVNFKTDFAKSSKDEVSGPQDQMYPIVSYDLNYAPNVVISREGQPWCTERFEFNKAACVYQMYLSGTELWVMPEAWTLTVQQIPRNGKEFDEDRELKELIAARLYSKFHQEACMHYGREFSSLDAWEEDRSKHARAVCLHVLSSWGVGISSRDLMV
ncbi:hypothetical protein PGTUg99_036491 [Puccinia graminis f. sp. tritici]|uniref:Glycosyltransferase family 49 protein n=1 Tax=Puccinia graminis f. sp. tritici TaxID=56615 RepID=A0A5B0RN95_PUCGR|nr:hypothetical protein PGTUg99_036491 [Puccinia graminis f. sp. tritici]